MKRILVCMGLACLVLTAGCTKKVVKQPPPTDPALKQINSAARDIQTELEKLSKMRMSYEQVEVFEAPEDGPLAQKLTLKWSGPLRDVLEVVASRIGFEFRVTGEAPSSPVLVTIDRIKVPAFKVLEDIGWKAGRHKVNVDADSRIVQLTYFRDFRAEIEK